MKLIVFSLLVAYAMAVPAPEATPEAAPEAEADPAVLASFSKTPIVYHAPIYGYGYGLGYYGLGLGHYAGHFLGKRSAEPHHYEPQPKDQSEGLVELTSEIQARYEMERYADPRYHRRMSMPSPDVRSRREAEPEAAPEAAPEAGPEAEAEAEAAAKAWYYAYGYGHGYYPYAHYGHGYGYARAYYGYRYPYYGGYYYGK